MPSPIYNVAFLSQSMQYTGSNSADILAEVSMVDFESESGGVLHLSMGETQYTLNTNDWIIWDVSSVMVLSNAQYLVERDCVAVCSDVAAVASDLSAATSYGAVRAIGMAPVPTLLLGQDTTVTVQIQPAMPDSGYSAYAITFGGVNLADLDVTSVSVVDTDTVDVAVDNVGAGTISGVTVMVHAVD